MGGTLRLFALAVKRTLLPNRAFFYASCNLMIQVGVEIKLTGRTSRHFSIWIKFKQARRRLICELTDVI